MGMADQQERLKAALADRYAIEDCEIEPSPERWLAPLVHVPYLSLR